jgi:hypothetical protein
VRRFGPYGNANDRGQSIGISDATDVKAQLDQWNVAVYVLNVHFEGVLRKYSPLRVARDKVNDLSNDEQLDTNDRTYSEIVVSFLNRKGGSSKRHH